MVDVLRYEKHGAIMLKSEILTLTDIETIKKNYITLLGDRIHTDGSHPLYNKGVFDGMEIILSALSESIKNRKQITNEA